MPAAFPRSGSAARAMNEILRFENVSFAWPGMVAPLLEGLTVQFDRGWTGIVGANGCGKTTLLRLASGELDPADGTVARPDSCLYVVQRTDDPPEGLDAFFAADDAPAWQVRADLDIGDDWDARWTTLSHGERKRLQIAIALWRAPGLLALDEPTNHLDAVARATLLAALRALADDPAPALVERATLTSPRTWTLDITL